MEFGSPVVADTVAVFDAVVAELNVFAVTLIVIMTKPPGLIEPRLQETVPALCEQLPWVVKTELYDTCAGRGSDTVTPCAVAGPLFRTWSVYTRFVL